MFVLLVILGGHFSNDGDQILEWKQTTGQWMLLQKKLKFRHSHAGMSVIKIKDVIDSINCT